MPNQAWHVGHMLSGLRQSIRAGEMHVDERSKWQRNKRAKRRGRGRHHIGEAHDGQLHSSLLAFFIFLDLLLVEALMLIQDRLQGCVKLSHALPCMPTAQCLCIHSWSGKSNSCVCRNDPDMCLDWRYAQMINLQQLHSACQSTRQLYVQAAASKIQQTRCLSLPQKMSMSWQLVWCTLPTDPKKKKQPLSLPIVDQHTGRRNEGTCLSAKAVRRTGHAGVRQMHKRVPLGCRLWRLLS